MQKISPTSCYYYYGKQWESWDHLRENFSWELFGRKPFDLGSMQYVPFELRGHKTPDLDSIHQIKRMKKTYIVHIILNPMCDDSKEMTVLSTLFQDTYYLQALHSLSLDPDTKSDAYTLDFIFSTFFIAFFVAFFH